MSRHQVHTTDHAADLRTQNKTHKESSYRDRLDRNKRPFGERISSSRYQVKPLRNKITSSYTRIPEEPPRNSAHADARSTVNLDRNASPHRTHVDLAPPQRPSQLTWREKSQTFRSPIRNTPPSSWAMRQDPLTSLQASPRPLEHNLLECDFQQLPLIPTTEEVMNDLHEFTLQYMNCDDHVESDARRQRVLQGDALG